MTPSHAQNVPEYMQLSTCVQAAPAAGFDAGQAFVTHCQRPPTHVQSAVSYEH